MIEFNNATTIDLSLIGEKTRYGVIVGVNADCDGTVDTRPSVEFEDGSIFYPSFTAWSAGGNSGTHYSSYWHGVEIDA